MGYCWRNTIYDVWGENGGSICSGQERKKHLNGGEIKTKWRPTEDIQMSKEPLAGDVWEVGHYCLISVMLAKGSLLVMLQDVFFPDS